MYVRWPARNELTINTMLVSGAFRFFLQGGAKQLLRNFGRGGGVKLPCHTHYMYLKGAGGQRFGKGSEYHLPHPPYIIHCMLV